MPDSTDSVGLAGAVGGFAKLEKFDGQGSVERFLDHFDVVARANGWSEVVQALQLPTALSGAAFDFFRRLPSEEKQTISQIKSSLITEFSSTALESDYALLFVSRRRQPGEPVPDFGEALKCLAHKAYPSFKDEQIDSLCKTHFVNGLSEALRVQLLLGASPEESFRDLVSRARRLEQVFAPPAVRRMPAEQDDLRGDVAKLTEVVSALEQKVAALSVTKGTNWRPRPPRPPQQQAKNAGDESSQKKPIICYRCKQPGHMARGCANFE